MFFVIGLPFCFVLPCFVTEYRASNFKIATAALRPRNDTESGRFCLKTDVFRFMRSFLRGVASHRFSNVSFRKLFRFRSFRSGNCSVFPQNLPNLSLRGGRIFAPDAAIFDGTICHSGTNYGCAERNKTIN